MFASKKLASKLKPANLNYGCTLPCKLALCLADNLALVQLPLFQIWSLLAPKKQDGDRQPKSKLKVQNSCPQTNKWRYSHYLYSPWSTPTKYLTSCFLCFFMLSSKSLTLTICPLVLGRCTVDLSEASMQTAACYSWKQI